MYKPAYKILLLLTVLSAIGGILTLIPRKAASYENVLGYRSFCTFAPAASFFCFLAAGTSCFFRSTFVKDDEGSKKDKFKRHGKSLIALALVLLLGIGSAVWFAQAKARYTDAGTAATG
ncbi:MAG: hypothetical protein E4H36_15330 [Spirochaetales bacterium]|nr:MAG: hypothetical protein E4H36_15330 [Spirochaetales bacterium]